MRKFSTNRILPIGFISLCLLLSINFQAIYAQEASDSAAVEPDKEIIYFFQLHEDIMPNAARLVDNALDEAVERNADVIIMELNTYGGRVDVADSIRAKLLNVAPLTVSYIINNAASAGALISIACDSIYMNKSSTIGAVTVVSQDGQQMPDKYQSYMRSKMRATAEAQGRNPDIAEAMVDDRISLPGIIDSGEVLTFTASEALKYDFTDGIVANLDEVIAALGITEYELIEHEVTPMDKIFAFLLNPIVSSILMLMIFGGIYFELQTPGIGFPIAAAVIGAVLYFAPLYIEGLAEHWEIVLFFVGIILIGVEIFVLPGFGAAGAAGIALIVGSLTLSLIQNDMFDFSVAGMDQIGIALLRVVVTLFAGIALMVAFGGSIFNSAAFKRITLQDEQLAEHGYSIRRDDIHGMVNKKGVAITDLRPSGKIEIDDEILDAMSEGGFIERGSNIIILKIETNTLIVREQA